MFFSRCQIRIKILYWDNDGYADWHNRPKADTFRVAICDGMRNITGIDLEQLFSGIDLSHILIRENFEKACIPRRETPLHQVWVRLNTTN